MTKDTLAVYSTKFNELRSIFDSLPDGIVTIIDKEITIVAANKAASELFKLPDKKL
jgi:PAS domain-containing protein